MTEIITQIPQDQRKLWQTKTFWASVVAGIIPIIPGADAWVASNPEMYSVILGIIFAGLRLVTKGKVVIK